jgi:hypothetical protein
MKRRNFIKQAGLAAGALAAAPWILPSGRLFAATGARKVNHVVFCLFAGGVRNIDSVKMNDGNLMPNLLGGGGGIAPDILPGMSMLPNPSSTPLQQYGTLFKEFRYAQGPTGHFNGHTVALTGQYTAVDLNLRERPNSPTLFELYRKHNSPQETALNSWWVSNMLGPYPYLNYSKYPGYGVEFGANMMAPTAIISEDGYSIIGNTTEYAPSLADKAASMRGFMNQNFARQQSEPKLNTPEHERQLKEFIRSRYERAFTGAYTNPWGLGSAMNNDCFNVLFAEEIIQTFKPELLVVNMQDVDVCHSNFTQYCDNLRKADFAVRHLWETIQATPGIANDTVLIVVPEHGRNLQPNTLVDSYGRAALDHTSDPTSREIFCMILGPSGVVKQNQVISGVQGQSVDVVPTIAWLLGFDSNIPSGILQGSPLLQAFN